MDYHGLKLLWTWMYDLDDGLNLSNIQIECKIKMIQVLSTMAIKNRTVLEEYKLLDMVKRWADQVTDSQSAHREKNQTMEALDTKVGTEEKDGVPQLLIQEILDKVVQESNEANGQLLRMLRDKSSELYDAWSQLKVNFKIPKKQRIEERKEHERKLNSTTTTTSSGTTVGSGGEPSEPGKSSLVGSTHSAASQHSYGTAYERFSRENTPKGKY
jgi:hypothetical protein